MSRVHTGFIGVKPGYFLPLPFLRGVTRLLLLEAVNEPRAASMDKSLKTPRAAAIAASSFPAIHY
jgi:hypothetical protein